MKYYLNQCLFYTLVLMAHLPIGLLYGLASFANFVNWNLIGYRKQVVLINLRNSFPEKSIEELKLYQRQFFAE